MQLRPCFAVVTLAVGSIVCGQSFSTRNDHRNLGLAELGFYLTEHDTGFIILQGGYDTLNGFRRLCFVLSAYDGGVQEFHSFGRDSLSCYVGWASGPAKTTAALFVFGTAYDGNRNSSLYWGFNSVLDSSWSTEVFTESTTASIGNSAAVNGYAQYGIGTLWHDSSEGEIFLVKLDTLGDVLWTREYGGSYRDEGWTIDTTADGGFILGGLAQFNDTNYDAYIIKTDSLGNEEWHRYLGGPYRDGHSNVITTANGEYVNVGKDATDQTFTTTVFKPYAARLSATGSTLWERTYGYWNTENELNTAKELPDGSFISCGTYHTGTRTAGTLLKFAANGDSLWMRTYVHPPLDTIFSYHTLYDVIQDDEGHFVSCGSTNDGQQDLWVIRVDSFGCLVPGCQQFDNIAEQSLNLNILAYPNPTRGTLFLSFRSIHLPVGEFVLFNSAGTMVQRFAPGGASVEIDYDIGHHPSGMYLLQYQEQGAVKWSQKVIKE